MTSGTQTRITTGRAVEAEGVICGAILRECRYSLQLNQDEMADKLMVDLCTYRSWEGARRPITHLTIHRYKALTRNLLSVGAPATYVELLDLAIEVDLAIGRALVSEDNPFPPTGRCDQWHALLAWALIGTTPKTFDDAGVVQTPRISAVDRNKLLKRIRYAVANPKGLDKRTVRTLKTVYLGVPPCPEWCDDHESASTGERSHDLYVSRTWGSDLGPCVGLGLFQIDDAEGPGEARVQMPYRSDGLPGIAEDHIYLTLAEAQDFINTMQGLVDKVTAVTAR